MLARVLFVLLAGVPVCRGAKGVAYSAYSDADEDFQNAHFYDSYNDEIKSPQKLTTLEEASTRLKRRDLDNIRALDPVEIIDVKGVLNNILQSKKPGYLRRRRTAQDNPEYYDYVENSIKGRPEFNTDKGSVIKNSQPTVKVQTWTPIADEQELDESLSQATEHWSFEYQPETSTYDKNDIKVEVSKLITVRDGPTQEVQTWSTMEETEEQEDTLIYPLESTTYSNSVMEAEVKKLVQHWSPINSVNMQESTRTFSNTEMQAEEKKLVQHWSPSSGVNMYPLESMMYSHSDMDAKLRKLVQHWSPTSSVNMQESTTTYSNSDMQAEVRKLVQHWSPSSSVNMYPLESTTYSHSVMDAKLTKLVQHWSPSSSVNMQESTTTYSNTDMQAEEKKLVQHWSPSSSMNQQNIGMQTEVSKLEHWSAPDDVKRRVSIPVPRTGITNDTNITTTASTMGLDFDAIIDIISNLTSDYETNLTEVFNKTLIEHGVPTCPWGKWGEGGAWTGTTDVTAWNFENSSVITKCFVCGLETTEIPRHAHCADAFAGDFLPLMPIDPQARGKIATFRKYCRYIDSSNYIENPDDPRAIYGRFTGGCAVRWTDITGVYTQRTCRSKYRPLMGKHLASKRMAKLELALVNVENGCIISPMATLLPVSRGISLYARFHACVCNTNWCNRATLEQASFNTLVTIELAYLLIYYP